MGQTTYNRKLLTKLIEVAATKRKAKIIVTPECAVHGYMDPTTDTVWTKDAPENANEKPVKDVAEPIPGDSTKYFATLAVKYKIYLCLGLIEVANGKYYNAQVLLNPKGKLIGHHRKQAMWMIGDGSWMTKGEREPQVIETEYGRLGMKICYDLHVMPEKLAAKKADIVLYSIGWYGGNTKNWYKNTFPLRYVMLHGFALIGANWCAAPKRPSWDGANYSTIYDKTGKVLKMASGKRRVQIVTAEIPLGEK
jgi:predicted amidohydrolase